MREKYMSPTHRLIQFLNFCFFILMITSIYGENTNSLLSIKLFKALLQDVGVCMLYPSNLGFLSKKINDKLKFFKVNSDNFYSEHEYQTASGKHLTGLS